jgi:hypothetical protein
MATVINVQPEGEHSLDPKQQEKDRQPKVGAPESTQQEESGAKAADAAEPTQREEGQGPQADAAEPTQQEEGQGPNAWLLKHQQLCKVQARPAPITLLNHPHGRGGLSPSASSLSGFP